MTQRETFDGVVLVGLVGFNVWWLVLLLRGWWGEWK